MCGTACLLHTVHAAAHAASVRSPDSPGYDEERSSRAAAACAHPGMVGRYLTLCKPPRRQPRPAPTHPGAGAAGAPGRWGAGAEPPEDTEIERGLVFGIR